MKKDDKTDRRNAEGYPDPTAYLALKSIEREERQKDFYSKLSKKLTLKIEKQEVR